jgi:hypothetical protein
LKAQKAAATAIAALWDAIADALDTFTLAKCRNFSRLPDMTSFMMDLL